MNSINALIHNFNINDLPVYDDEGDLMLGSYYQFIDENNEPVGAMIGPYRDQDDAIKAARKAFKYNDF